MFADSLWYVTLGVGDEIATFSSTGSSDNLCACFLSTLSWIDLEDTHIGELTGPPRFALAVRGDVVSDMSEINDSVVKLLSFSFSLSLLSAFSVDTKSNMEAVAPRLSDSFCPLALVLFLCLLS